jgi:hypothetical protein
MCFLGTDGYKKLWSRREKGKIFTLDNYSVRNSYIFYGVIFVTLIFQQRRGYSVGLNLYGKCFKQDHGERCNGFFHIERCYICNIDFFHKMGILTGFVCNMFFVNVTYVMLFCTAS